MLVPLQRDEGKSGQEYEKTVPREAPLSNSAGRRMAGAHGHQSKGPLACHLFSISDAGHFTYDFFSLLLN